MRDFTKEPLKFEPVMESIAVIYDGKTEKTQGGLYIPVGPEGEGKYPAIGTVIALSKEAEESGYEIGTKILYHGYMAEDVRIDGAQVDIVNTINVLGKILL